MAPLETLLAFAITAAVFAYMPGPALLYTAAQTLALGRRGGLMAALGIHLGGYFHVLAAAAGLAVLLEAVPLLYSGIKLAGALYLIWLGISIWRGGNADETNEAARRAAPAGHTLLRSVLVEVLNPKAALFFVAFLPQFVDVSGALPAWTQFLILGTAVNVLFTSADLVCVVLAGSVINALRRPGAAQRAMRQGGGAILVGLGVHLALQRS